MVYGSNSIATASNLLLAERSWKPGSGRIHGGERGWLFLGGDGFGRHVVKVVWVIGADEGREGYLVVGDFGGEGEGDFLGSFPGRGDHFSPKAFCFGALFESDVDFLGAQFFRNGVADDEGDLFAWGGGFGGSDGEIGAAPSSSIPLATAGVSAPPWAAGSRAHTKRPRWTSPTTSSER